MQHLWQAAAERLQEESARLPSTPILIQLLVMIADHPLQTGIKVQAFMVTEIQLISTETDPSVRSVSIREISPMPLAQKLSHGETEKLKQIRMDVANLVLNEAVDHTEAEERIRRMAPKLP